VLQPLVNPQPSTELLGVKSPEQLIGNASSFFDAEFAHSLEAKAKANLAKEKADAKARQIETAKELQRDGSVINNVMGQKMGSIDARIYHRWNLQYPGCWQDREFVQAFFHDNPQCRSPGWKPKQYTLRHGVVFQNGKPITPHSSLSP
jgi:hypothetical protein